MSYVPFANQSYRTVNESCHKCECVIVTRMNEMHLFKVPGGRLRLRQLKRDINE